MTADKKHKLADRIAHASIVVAAAHLCLKFTGLIQARVATQYLEPDVFEPVMTVAFTNVIIPLFLIGEEVIGPTFLPVFMRELDDDGEASAWSFANALLTLQFIILLLVVGLVVCFPDVIIRTMTMGKWSAGAAPTQYQLLRQSLTFLAPSLIFLSIGSTTYMLLNGYKKFFLAAFGDASTKICVTVALLVGMGLFGMDHRAVVFGILIGSAAKLLTHLLGMLGKLRFIRPNFNFRNPALRTVLILMIPLFVGIVFAKVRDLFNNVTILTNIDQSGVMMANDLGRKLFTSIQWLVPYALQIALFPFLCELVDRKDRVQLGQVLNGSCRLMLSVFVPGAVLLAVLAQTVSAFIFLGGRMTLDVLMWTGMSTACYILVLPAAAMECVLMQGYFADRRTVSVTTIGVGTSIVSMVISYVFIVIMHVQAVQALMVVALGFVISRYLKSVILALVLRRSVPLFPWRQTSSFAIRLTLLGAGVGLVTWLASKGMDRLLPDGLTAARDLVATHGPGNVAEAVADEALHAISRTRMLMKLVISAVIGGIVFLPGAFVLGVREPFAMVHWALDKYLGNRLAHLIPFRPDPS